MKSKKVIFYLYLLPMLLSSATTIERAYTHALKYEASLQSYSYQVKAKEEEIVQAKSRLYPKLDVSASTTSSKTDYSGLIRDEKYSSVTLMGEVPLYHPEYLNNIEQSKLHYSYSDIYLNQLKQDLAGRTVDAFMSIVRAKNSLEVARAYLEANRARYEQIKKMYKRRLSNKMDLLTSRVTYEESKIKLNSEKQNLHLAKIKFKNLTGIKKIIIPTINLEHIDISKLVISTTKEEVERLNLEIKKSNVNIALMHKQIENARYGYYPKVDLTASVSKYNTSSPSIYDNGSKIMVTMRIPLYQGGYTSSQVAKYRYLLSAAGEELKDVERKTVSDYEELAIKLETAKENILLYKEAIKSAKLNLYAVNKGYESGLKNLIDVEDAKTKLFETKFKLIDAVYTYITSYSTILGLLGSLDKEKVRELDSVLFTK